MEGLLVNRPCAKILEVLTLEGQVVVGSLDDPVDEVSCDREFHVAHVRHSLLLSREDEDRWQASLTLFFREDLRPVSVMRRRVQEGDSFREGVLVGIMGIEAQLFTN
jgi:hypothetical protein